MDQIVTGNANDATDTRGWFVGGFLPESAGIRKNDRVEIKWGVHPKGQQRHAYAKANGKTTICTLVSGEFELEFDGGQKIRLSEPGDYVMWGPDVGHTWHIMQDSIAMTVRW